MSKVRFFATDDMVRMGYLSSSIVYLLEKCARATEPKKSWSEKEKYFLEQAMEFVAAAIDGFEATQSIVGSNAFSLADPFDYRAYNWYIDFLRMHPVESSDIPSKSGTVRAELDRYKGLLGAIKTSPELCTKDSDSIATKLINFFKGLGQVALYQSLSYGEGEEEVPYGEAGV